MSASGVWLKSNLFRAALRARRNDIAHEYSTTLYESAQEVRQGYFFTRPTSEQVIEWWRNDEKLGLGDRITMGRAWRKYGDAVNAIARLDRAAMLADEIFVSSEDIKLVGI